MIAVILAAVLAFSVALNVGFVLLVNEQRATDRLRRAAMRGMKARLDAQSASLTDTECALGLAKEILAERDVPQCEIDLLTPIHDAVAADEAEREATILQFRRELDRAWDEK